MSLTLERFVEFPRAAPSGIPQTSLGFRGHLITNFPHIMVLLIIIHKRMYDCVNISYDINHLMWPSGHIPFRPVINVTSYYHTKLSLPAVADRDGIGS
jgi:hypothetical protein